MHGCHWVGDSACMVGGSACVDGWVCMHFIVLIYSVTLPWTVPSPAEKGGGLGVGLAPPPCKETQRYRNIHNK